MAGQCDPRDVVVEPLSVNAKVFFGRAMVVLRDEDCSVSVNLSREQIEALDIILKKILTVMDGEEYRIMS